MKGGKIKVWLNGTSAGVGGITDGTNFDLSRLADDARQLVELVDEGFELLHGQFSAISTALRTEAAAAETYGKPLSSLLT